MSTLPSLDWTLVAQALRHGGPEDMVAELDRQGFKVVKKTKRPATKGGAAFGAAISQG